MNNNSTGRIFYCNDSSPKLCCRNTNPLGRINDNENRQMYDAMAIAASRRIDEGDNRIPFIKNALDSDVIDRINKDDSLADFRLGIVLNLKEGTCDPNVQPFILGRLDNSDLIEASLAPGKKNYHPLINTALLTAGLDCDIANSLDEVRKNVDVEVLVRDMLAEQETGVGEQETGVGDASSRFSVSNLFENIKWGEVAKIAGLITLGAIGSSWLGTGTLLPFNLYNMRYPKPEVKSGVVVSVEKRKIGDSFQRVGIALDYAARFFGW